MMLFIDDVRRCELMDERNEILDRLEDYDGVEVSLSDAEAHMADRGRLAEIEIELGITIQ